MNSKYEIGTKTSIVITGIIHHHHRVRASMVPPPGIIDGPKVLRIL